MSYRPCVGIALFNPKGEVFIGQRIDALTDAWQMPQGGIDNGETAEAAARRELREEVGLDDAQLLEVLPERYRYDLPEALAATLWNGAFLGQEQQWFALLHSADDSAIDIKTAHPEFRAWRWIALEHLCELVVPFKRDVYSRIVPALIRIRDARVRRA